MKRRMQVLVALAMGCAFGSAATGCAFVWLGTARADSGPPQGQVITVPCNVQGTDKALPTGHQNVTFAVQSFPGSSAADLALNVYALAAKPQAAPNVTVNGDATYLGSGARGTIAVPADLVQDGSVAFECGPDQTSVSLYVRQ